MQYVLPATYRNDMEHLKILNGIDTFRCYYRGARDSK